jgi:pimeloyl-ACP methyl ester carboxylesterase
VIGRKSLTVMVSLLMVSLLSSSFLSSSPAIADSASSMLSRSNATSTSFISSPLTWKPCQAALTLDCSTLTVPLDYEKPSGKTLSIAVNRLKATSSAKRIGVLLVNPGGPGGSGIDFAQRAAALFSQSVRASFDIIGFDPRGVGRSQGIQCLTPKQLDRFFAADPSPDTPAEVDELFSVSSELASACTKKYGVEFLKQVGTRNVARDMDLLRAALNEETVSMLGLSYGSLLGATFADLFPGRVRAFALDGALDASVSLDGRALEQAKGFERALRLFVDDCALRTACSKRLGKDPMVTIDGVLASVETKPMKVGRRKVGPGEAMLGLVRPLYSERRGWPQLEAALVDAKAGQGAKLLALSDAYTDRGRDGTYGSLMEANVAVNCADVSSQPDPQHYARLAKQFVAVAPHFGEALAYGNVVCAAWPVKGAPSGWKTPAKGTPTMLVIGTRNDPATPYVWAQQMAAGFERGVLLTWEGNSHTAYFSGNQCVRAKIDDYLIAQIIPRTGTACPA